MFQHLQQVSPYLKKKWIKILPGIIILLDVVAVQQFITKKGKRQETEEVHPKTIQIFVQWYNTRWIDNCISVYSIYSNWLLQP